MNKKLTESRKAKILEECLAGWVRGEQVLEDCERRYPALTNELRQAHQVWKKLQTSGYVELEGLKLQAGRARMLARLPAREVTVTKPAQGRYIWQTSKWRFAMTWIIVITTLISLASGAGVVLASDEALPGDALFPVKTWVEDVQLALAPDEADARLHLTFSEYRLEEMQALLDAGRHEDVYAAAQGYLKHTELLAQLMPALQAHNPDEAIRLRTELETKLREQARVMEGLLIPNGNANREQLQEHIRTMLQSNTQTRARVNQQVVPLPEDPTVVTTEEPSGSGVQSDASHAGGQAGESGSGNGGQNRQSEFVGASGDEQYALFTFRVGNASQTGVYTLLNGMRYTCQTEGDLVTCGIPKAAKNGNLYLYSLADNSFLYSYSYFYNWLGTKEVTPAGNQLQGEESGSGGSGGDDNGQGGQGGNGKK